MMMMTVRRMFLLTLLGWGTVLCLSGAPFVACTSPDTVITEKAEGASSDGGVSRDGQEQTADQRPKESSNPSDNVSHDHQTNDHQTSKDATPDQSTTDDTSTDRTLPKPDTTTTDTTTTDTTITERPSPPEGSVDTARPEALPDRPIVPTNSCYDLIACGEQRCSWPYPIPCLDQCATTLQGAALTRWQSLRACLLQRCANCGVADTKCQTSCAAAYCAQEWVVCASDEKLGAEACKDVAACVTQCGKQVSPCHARCVQKADKNGQDLYTRALVCSGQEGLGQQSTQRAQRAVAHASFEMATKYTKSAKSGGSRLF